MPEQFRLVAQARAPGLFGIESCLRYHKWQVGEPLLLVREPDNPVDPNAVIIASVFMQNTAYIDRVSAAMLASRLDGGALMLCTVQAPPVYDGKFLKQNARVLIVEQPPEVEETKIGDGKSARLGVDVKRHV